MTRRAVLTGLLASLLVGPAGAAINQPFGAHTFSYAPGSIRPDHVSQSVQDQAVRDFYDAWKGQYLKQGCGAGRYYVATSTQPGNLTVSEGHGYGMVSLRFKGEAVILKPWQAVDPVVHGMRVVVDALSGPGGIDVTIPAGARAGGVGWQANSALAQWTYTDPAGHGGITRVVVKDRSRVTDGLVRWIIKGRVARSSCPTRRRCGARSWWGIRSSVPASCGTRRRARARAAAATVPGSAAASPLVPPAARSPPTRARPPRATERAEPDRGTSGRGATVPPVARSRS